MLFGNAFVVVNFFPVWQWIEFFFVYKIWLSKRFGYLVDVGGCLTIAYYNIHTHTHTRTHTLVRILVFIGICFRRFSCHKFFVKFQYFLHKLIYFSQVPLVIVASPKTIRYRISTKTATQCEIFLEKHFAIFYFELTISAFLGLTEFVGVWEGCVCVCARYFVFISKFSIEFDCIFIFRIPNKPKSKSKCLKERRKTPEISLSATIGKKPKHYEKTKFTKCISVFKTLDE